MTSLDDVFATRVTERDPNRDAAAAPLGKNGHDVGVFGQEESTVGENAYFVLGRLENRAQVSRVTAQRCG